AVLALSVGLLVMLRFAFDGSWAPALAGTGLLALWGLRGPVASAIPRFGADLASLIYPVGLLSLFVDIRWKADAVWGQQDGFLLVLLLFVLIWVTDTGAYYTGRSLGRTKFAPETSPNKTWEGTLGGLVCALLAAVLFKSFWFPYMSWLDVIVLAAIGGFWAQLGDLLESSLKRSAGVKDSGTFLPGHGGMLDRFDSLIMAAPAYWLWLEYGSILFGG
ncbi:MAG: phosphatidate cytidylyltransferase, partial [Bacteroidetes bacterium]|nr:phosphatidate cytidylyltransferase [Bacteroidota bacterium]